MAWVCTQMTSRRFCLFVGSSPVYLQVLGPKVLQARARGSRGLGVWGFGGLGVWGFGGLGFRGLIHVGPMLEIPRGGLVDRPVKSVLFRGAHSNDRPSSASRACRGTHLTPKP